MKKFKAYSLKMATATQLLINMHHEFHNQFQLQYAIAYFIEALS